MKTTYNGLKVNSINITIKFTIRDDEIDDEIDYEMDVIYDINKDKFVRAYNGDIRINHQDEMKKALIKAKKEIQNLYL